MTAPIPRTLLIIGGKSQKTVKKNLVAEVCKRGFDASSLDPNCTSVLVSFDAAAVQLHHVVRNFFGARTTGAGSISASVSVVVGTLGKETLCTEGSSVSKKSQKLSNVFPKIGDWSFGTASCAVVVVLIAL